jgi:hypothetical protein
MESFYYTAMFDLLQGQREISEKTISLKHIKTKMIRLNNEYYRSMMVDTSDYDRFRDEEPSLHHLLKERKRQRQRTIHTLCDNNVTIQHTSIDILRAFAEHFRQKYDTKPIQTDQIRTLLECNMPRIPEEANEQFEQPIIMDELHYAIKAGKPHKSPGHDGIPHEFFKLKWEVIKEELLQIMNEMYVQSIINDTQKHGIIVSPKASKRTKVG